jgi:thiol-disulfide isomerase/thioredoxin
MNHLLHFYGKECPHCDKVRPVIDAFEKETGQKVDRIEVWHDKKNEKLFLSYDKNEECGGVPFFINTKTNKTICGEATVKEIKEWAKE